MPENEFPKLVPHPFRASGESAPAPHHHPFAPVAELCVTTNYTFLTGASHPEEMVRHAAAIGYSAVAITDTNSLAGIVRAHVAAKECGIHLVIGARLRLQDLPHASLFLYAVDMPSYRKLCRLLTIGKRRAPKGECHLTIADVAAHVTSHFAILMMDHGHHADARSALDALHGLNTDDRLSLALTHTYALDDDAVTAHHATLSRDTEVPLVATSDVHYHTSQRRMLQDVLTCIRHTCTLPQAGYNLHPNAERHFKPPEELHRLYAAHPAAIQRAIDLASRARGFTLDQLRYEYPDEVVPPGKTAMAHLRDLAWQGARDRYPDGIPTKVINHLNHELTLIEELNYAPYFLTVHDLVNFARSRTPPILCQGRGAAANSAVCYCLGVTSVDPTRIDLLFERFISKERNEPPDIDIDFEHERREEVIQYIYTKYGRDRAALTAEVISYRRRSAVRDVGKALGLSLDMVDRLAKDMDWWDTEGLNVDRLREMGLDPADPTIIWLGVLTRDILGFPRHLSQHVGGFVITRSPLCELVPVENAAMPDRTVIEWDKDDIDAAGMLKVDCLGLGMLSCIRRALELVNQRRASESAHASALSTQHSPLALHTIPAEDPATYRMIQAADTIGVFQIESRAQMSMLPRLKPANFYDLVIEVAIVRPGPIQGDMVHPYLRRRNGEEPVHYVHPAIEEVLKRTLGVPLFQEQCMALAVKAAGFTPGEADQLRRAMAAWKRKGDLIYRFGQKIIDGMVARGIPEEFARRCFEQIKGFSEYGFPESHAASFALLVYASCWLKCHYPAEFAAALLNSQPMGFYAPAQIIRDAKNHNVTVRPIDINHSAWDCTMEPRGVIRLGMRLVNGLSRSDADLIHHARHAGRFDSMLAIWKRSGCRASALRRLAAADAFGSLNLSRQEALWQARLIKDEDLPLFDPVLEHMDAEPGLPRLPLSTQVVLDYNSTGLSLKAHPMAFQRAALSQVGAITCARMNDITRTKDGDWVTVAGLVLVRQRPGTAGGVMFMTLEDETAAANLIIWPRVYEKYRRPSRANALLASGRVQREAGVIHLIVSSLAAWMGETTAIDTHSRNFH
jgi:error-prone DNA polymerase